MAVTDTDRLYLARALQLARAGAYDAHPNPMVGAVLVGPDGRIAGEGWHRICGSAHAEVNALAGVPADTDLSAHTIYVSLEPCAHFGRTPPCARLIVERGVGRCVVGTIDPFSRVAGKGLEIMRQGGVTVEVLDETDPLADECRQLNRRFFTAHTLHRPYVVLKWAMSSDGYMDSRTQHPYRFSTPLGLTEMHRHRATCDAIMVGSGTWLADSPQLTVRRWPVEASRQPVRVVADRRGRIPGADGWMVMRDYGSLDELLRRLYDEGITSLMVEGGPTLLASFVDSGLWDEARVEVSPVILGADGTAPAPKLPGAPITSRPLHPNVIHTFVR